jgi:GTP-binding protein Era
MPYKSGFIALIGKPNAGKSTLMNTLIGQKVAIVSPKPQTTRNKILGILSGGDFQMIFVDTPGFLRPLSSLDKYMNKSTDAAVKQVDIIVFLIDGSKDILERDVEQIARYEGTGVPVIIAVTKTDLTNAQSLMPRLLKLNDLSFVKGVVPLSSFKHKNIDVLKSLILENLVEGDMYYPEDMVTDKSERFIVSELIRERILYNFEQEIPHGVGVNINKMKLNSKKNIYEIDADIVCEKASHKKIIIGDAGSKLKKVCTQSRIALEDSLQKKVFLTVWVRVKENWRGSDFLIKDFGYDKNEI